LLLVAGALWLAGCAGAPTVYNARIYHDRWQDFFYGGGTPEYRAVVWGNPFDTPKAATEAVVIASIERAYNNARASFSTSPELVNPLVPYVSMVFNANRISSGAPCGNLDVLRPVPAPSGNVRLLAALCRAGTTLTAAQGFVDGVSGPDDPRFRQLVYQIAIKLFHYQPGSQHQRADLRQQHPGHLEVRRPESPLT
jgi:hypothetical protein